MKSISNDLLIAAYIKAIELDLDEEFQFILKEEIVKRKLDAQQFIDKSMIETKEKMDK